MTIINQDLEQAATLQALIDAEAEDLPTAGQTGTARSKAIAAAISSSDIDELMALQVRMSGIIQQIVANKIDLDELGLLDGEQREDFLRELLDQKDVKRLLDVRYDMLRSAFFAHITEANKAKGVHNPEHTPGEIEVPALGKRVVREGGKVKASLDLPKLQAALGKKWAKVTETVHHEAVAAYTEQVFDEDKMLELATSDPKVMEIMSKCIKPAGYGTERLMVRNLDKKVTTDE